MISFKYSEWNCCTCLFPSFSSCFLTFLIIFPSPGSPFRPSIQDSIDASKVKAHGPGLSKDGVRANVPAKFTVDATKAGKAPLDVTVIQEKGKFLITNPN